MHNVEPWHKSEQEQVRPMSERSRAEMKKAAPLLLDVLKRTGTVRDTTGRASDKLATMAGINRLLAIETLKLMERDGQIVRDIRGKRTFEIRLPKPGETPEQIRKRALDRAAQPPSGRTPKPKAGTPTEAMVVAHMPPPAPPEPTPPPAPEPATEIKIETTELAAALLRHVIDLANAPNRNEQQTAQLKRDYQTSQQRLGDAVAETQRLRRQLREAQDLATALKDETEGLRQRAQLAEHNLKQALTAPPLDTERERQLRELTKVMQTKPGAYAGNTDTDRHHQPNSRPT